MAAGSHRAGRWLEEDPGVWVCTAPPSKSDALSTRVQFVITGAPPNRERIAPPQHPVVPLPLYMPPPEPYARLAVNSQLVNAELPPERL